MSKNRDAGLDYLLDLNGQILVQEKGCWIKIEARKLSRQLKEWPHGIKYSLTLHDKYGKRLLGFDNAHPVKSKKRGKYQARRIFYDYVHKDDEEIEPYVFKSAGQLVEDFFAEVDKILAVR